MNERAKKQKIVKTKCEQKKKERMQTMRIHSSQYNEHNNDH